MTDPSQGFSTDLSGQVALVTGTTSGLGRRFAQVLAAHGAKVALTGRRVERLAELEKEIQASGGQCASFPLDMTDADNILSVASEVEQALGAISILVNNAGIPDAKYATQMSVELIDDVIGTNLRGPYILSCEVARRLIKKKQPGRMVNISSIGAFTYEGHGAALYSMTKSAIARMTDVLAVEWAKFHINVNCIAPGLFESEMTDGMLERMGDFSRDNPRKRIGRAHQLDSTLLYMVSPSSDAVTGTTIKVDDGQTPR